MEKLGTSANYIPFKHKPFHLKKHHYCTRKEGIVDEV